LATVNCIVMIGISSERSADIAVTASDYNGVCLSAR